MILAGTPKSYPTSNGNQCFEAGLIGPSSQVGILLPGWIVYTVRRADGLAAGLVEGEETELEFVIVK